MVSNTLYILIAIFTILAIIIGPILAVQVETYLGRRREAKNLRLYVFRTLMINRKIPLSPYRIDALNLIDLYFDKDENVTKEWRAYLDLLNSLVKETTLEEK
ncbi:MAG: hypothetical protein M1576_03880 [Deltaproteobacteria bacterium]|nr:hypothetical protein [Deltaproteobacteria bacterium]